MFKSKRYLVEWRHRTKDAPGYPYHGAGECWGRTRREALRNYFNPWGVQGHSAHLYDIQAAFQRGELEIEMRRG
jgi:hypothetical protein